MTEQVNLWTAKPNWSTTVKENLEWLTDVYRAYDGTEQRRGLRQVARRSFEYDFTAAGSDAQRVDNLLWGWQNKTYALPVWVDSRPLTATAAIGDMTIAVATDLYSFAAGSMVVVYSSASLFELKTIISLTGTTITLDTPLEKAWSRGVSVYPVVLARLSTEVPLQRLTGGVLMGTVSFTTSPGNTTAFTPLLEAATTCGDFEVITQQPNWADAIKFANKYTFSTSDGKTGIIEWSPSEKGPNVQRDYAWLLANRQSIYDFRGFLRRLRGQYKTCLVPTWTDDLTLVEDVGSTDTLLRVLDTGYSGLIGTDPNRSKIMFRLGGGYLFRQITAATLNEDGTANITIDSPLGQAATIKQVKGIHFLLQSRLAADKILIEWNTNQVVVVNTTFTSIIS